MHYATNPNLSSPDTMKARGGEREHPTVTMRTTAINLEVSPNLLSALDAEVQRRRKTSMGLKVTRTGVVRSILITHLTAGSDATVASAVQATAKE